MKASDVVTQLAIRLPQFTDKFTDNYSVTSLTRSGTTVTATTAANHTLKVGGQTNVVGAQTPISVTSISRAGVVGTMVTATNHDFTEGVSTEVIVTGAAEAEFNGTFTLLTVPNRKTVTFTMADSGATVATGTPLLHNGSSVFKSYNGLYAVTAVPAANQFQYEVTDSTLFTPASGTIEARTMPRISAAVTGDRASDAYTKQGVDSLWAFVVLGDVFASKDRNTLSDATSDIKRNEHYKQPLIQPLSVYIFFPASTEIAARQARDNAEDIFRPLCRSLLFKGFDSGLYVGQQNTVNFVDHGLSAYTTAFYAHVFNFQQVVDITFEDTVGYDEDVAFRDIDLTMGVDVGTGVMTATIDLDDEQLP